MALDIHDMRAPKSYTEVWIGFKLKNTSLSAWSFNYIPWKRARHCRSFGRSLTHSYGEAGGKRGKHRLRGPKDLGSDPSSYITSIFSYAYLSTLSHTDHSKWNGGNSRCLSKLLGGINKRHISSVGTLNSAPMTVSFFLPTCAGTKPYLPGMWQGLNKWKAT